MIQRVFNVMFRTRDDLYPVMLDSDLLMVI